MKAIPIHGRGGPDHLVYEDAPKPHPGPGEVLVHVYATSVIATELTWTPTYQDKAGRERTLPIPGHDLSGVVEEVGSGVINITTGTEVYALIAFDRDGAEAEYTITLSSELAPKPRTLDHSQAAAVPLAALTAWQALFDHANLVAEQTVLIQGAAGGVGSLLSSLLAGLARMSSRLPRRAIVTSCSSWEPTKSLTLPPRALRMWYMMLILSSIWLVVTPCSDPGRW